MALATGRRLGEYEILSLLGMGGMGEVYCALDTRLGRKVALKVLPEEFSGDKERRARFEREARLLASLNHPGIATLYGLEEREGVSFLAMELVEGETLDARIARGPMASEEALPLFKQMVEALQAAHEKSVIHRDLKPANIKVTPDGKIKLLDFGLAKALEGEIPSTDLSRSPTLTRGTAAGAILGTAPYMSPEQARGKAVDRRTDIWALGCVLFEALTARRTFEGESVADVLGAIVKTEPRWELLPADTPPKVRELLGRCLQKDPRRRLRDIGDAWVAIEEALSEPAGPVTVPGGRRERTAPVLVATLVALLATAVAVWSLLRTESKPVTRSVIPFAPGEELGVTDYVASIAVSPDGGHVVYVAREAGSNGRLYLRALDQLDGMPIDGTEGAAAPFFSADGQWVGFHRDGRMMKVSVTGGAPVTIGQTGSFRGASWGPDDEIVFSRTDSNSLSRIPAAGGEPEVLRVPDHGRREKTFSFPEVLPGRKAVLFTLATGDIESYYDASVAVLSLKTGEVRVVLEGGTQARYSPTGHLVYARAGSLLAVPFDPGALRVTGAPVPVIERVTTNPIAGHAEFSVSGNGSLLYAPGDSWKDNRRAVWVDRDGRADPILTTPRAYGWRPSISARGSLMAVNVHGANTSVWVYDFARSTFTPVATGFDNVDPVWTPDESRLVFTSNRAGTRNLFWQAADGSDEAEPLFPSGFWQIPGSFSPDGKILAFHQRSPDTGYDIWVLSTQGARTAEPFLQTRFREEFPSFSPNGRFLAYESDESGRREVYIRPFPSSAGKWQVSTDGGEVPRWNPNGREIFYRNGDQMMVVDVETEGELELGRPRTLFTRRSFEGGYDVATDGHRFVMVDEGDSSSAPTRLILVQNWAEELRQRSP